MELIFLPILILIVSSSFSITGATTIAFSTVGRANYAFDIFAVPTTTTASGFKEIRLSDGKSVNYNGYFPSPSSLSVIPSTGPDPATHFLYVSERNGSSDIYLDVLYNNNERVGSRSILEAPTESPTRLQIPLLSDKRLSMKDKPSLVGENLIYVSTKENPGFPRRSWAAVYSTNLRTRATRRLTPEKVADFSPAVSPTGKLTAVASYGLRNWPGDVQELKTDIYVFSTEDGSKRVKLVDHGGWPSWVNDTTLYFHRKCEDGWWSIFLADISVTGSTDIRRITPPGIHAFTPAAFISDPSILAVATRRSESEFRHIEIYDIASNKFIEITRHISPKTHHYNPFISPDSKWIGFHRCRGGENDNNLLLEKIQSPIPNISLLRIDGSYPSYSPDGRRIAFVNSGLYVMNSDGSNLRKILNQQAFSTAWDYKRKGVVYTSIGPTFAGVSTKVDVISINVDDEEPKYKVLTRGGENNAFPSPSPDGKWIVFRSGRSGHKNLYIMDALKGEEGGIHQLTDGPWTDTMCNWSPDGEWIAFSSDRDDPEAGSFELFKVHPNGTELQKVIQSGIGGRVNHPWFSPDGEHIVVTSDYAAVSAEPISHPHHWQPYGDIFMMKSDGTGIKRLTHNAYEDGTPAWGPLFTDLDNVERNSGGSKCSFDDCHWLNSV